MANGILDVAQRATHHTHQYHLPEADRQAILAQAGPTAAQRTERMRESFLAAFGGCDAFGHAPQKNPKNS